MVIVVIHFYYSLQMLRDWAVMLVISFVVTIRVYSFLFFCKTRLAEQHEGHRDVRLEFSRGGKTTFSKKQKKTKNKKKSYFAGVFFFFQLTHEKNVYREFHHHDIWYVDEFTLCV